MMNISDIAKLAGVSKATVSRVLNNPDTVRSETRAKVRQIMRESNYTPNAMARSLSMNIYSTIGVAIPDIQNHFFSGMLRGISQQAANFGYNVYFSDTGENLQNQQRFLSMVQEHRFKGIIMSPVMEEDADAVQIISNLEAAGIPVILVDRSIQKIQLDGVFFEDIVGSYNAVKCLAEAGHKRIATIAGPQNMKPGRERLEGYRDALRAFGLEIEEDYIVDGRFFSDGGYDAAKSLMNLSRPPTAIFCANNLMTLGCIKYLRENKIGIGQDIGLVGYDEIEELTFAGYNLTTVQRNTVEMGEEAVNLIQWRLDEAESLGKRHKQVIIGTNLIVRGSEKKKRDRRYA